MTNRLLGARQVAPGPARAVHTCSKDSVPCSCVSLEEAQVPSRHPGHPAPDHALTFCCHLCGTQSLPRNSLLSSSPPQPQHMVTRSCHSSMLKLKSQWKAGTRAHTHSTSRAQKALPCSASRACHPHVPPQDSSCGPALGCGPHGKRLISKQQLLLLWYPAQSSQSPVCKICSHSQRSSRHRRHAPEDG